MKWYWIPLLFLILTGSVFSFKKDSTSGRWFILENTFEIIKDNPKGIGWNKFKVVYNLRQAEYFKHHPINDKTALLADDVEFALNEYLQIAAEGGIVIGIVFLLFNILTVFFAIRWYRAKPSSLILASIIGLIGILTACLTFYILHCWWILGFYFLCLIGIYGSYFINKKRLTLILLVLLLIAIFPLITGTVKEKKFRSELKDVVILSINGYKKIADSIFNNLEHTRPLNPSLMIEYGKHLYLFGETDSALLISNKARKIISRSSLYILLGDIYFNKQRLSEAEYYYKTGVYMVPNKFISRKKLADFYKKTNNPQEEIYWLKSIMELPEKIPSEITKTIKTHSYERLAELQRIDQ